MSWGHNHWAEQIGYVLGDVHQSTLLDHTFTADEVRLIARAFEHYIHMTPGKAQQFESKMVEGFRASSHYTTATNNTVDI